MPLSKVRASARFVERELETPPEGDLSPFVVFTQLREGGPFIYAGFVDALDAPMAVELACEHYGQDQECTALLAIDRARTAGAAPDGARPPGADDARPGTHLVFVQAERGDAHVSTTPIETDTLGRAHDEALAAHPAASSVWVVHTDDTLRTPEGTLIWRLTDQSYRLARGYSKDVRAKWEQVRRERDINEYEKDDLKETF